MERLDPSEGLMDGVEIDVEVPDTTGEWNLGKKRNLAVNFSRKIYCIPYFNVDIFLWSIVIREYISSSFIFLEQNRDAKKRSDVVS